MRKQDWRVSTYRALEKRRDEIQTAINLITMDQPDDPNKTGPFTGNHRESRRVLALHIVFSETRGQSPVVERTLVQLGIEANEFGKLLVGMLRAKQAEVRKEMEEL